MLTVHPPVDSVTRLHLGSRLGRAVGYTVSVYLTRGVLVDTAFPRAAPLVRRLCDERPVRGAVVTHAHEDHGGNAALLARRGVPLLAGEGTLARLRAAPRRLPLYRHAVWGSPAPLGHAEPFADDALALLPAPGHTPDHHVLWDAEREHLFGGDLFLGVKVRIAHPGEDPRQLARTLRDLARLRPRWLFDAHRGLVAAPAPLLEAKAGWLEDRIALVEQLAGEGASDREIRRRVLGPERWEAFGTLGEYSALNFVRLARGGRDVADRAA